MAYNSTGLTLEQAVKAQPKYEMQGYEVSVLFLLFVAITVSWECILGVLTFINNLVRGKRANWLARVKEEVLALGVVSLVLLFLQPVLERICKSSSDTEAMPYLDFSGIPGASFVCPPGTRNVFSGTVIHAAHYLLFYLAVVHILFNMVTNSITAKKFAWMVAMEREARSQDVEWEAQQVAMAMEGLTDGDAALERIDPLLEESVASSDSGSSTGSDQHTSQIESWFNKQAHKLSKTWDRLTNSIDQRSFSLLRKICMQRFEAHAMDSNVRSFSYVNIASQVLEADLEQVYAHAWLMILFMTFLLLYPKILYQVVWANFLCLVILLVLAFKLHRVLDQSVEIARQVLLKGVKHQRHLRKEERLVQQAGSDKDSSDDEDTKPLRTAPSFQPFKRAASFANSTKSVARSVVSAPSEGDDDDDPLAYLGKEYLERRAQQQLELDQKKAAEAQAMRAQSRMQATSSDVVIATSSIHQPTLLQPGLSIPQSNIHDTSAALQMVPSQPVSGTMTSPTPSCGSKSGMSEVITMLQMQKELLSLQKLQKEKKQQQSLQTGVLHAGRGLDNQQQTTENAAARPEPSNAVQNTVQQHNDNWRIRARPDVLISSHSVSAHQGPSQIKHAGVGNQQASLPMAGLSVASEEFSTRMNMVPVTNPMPRQGSIAKPRRVWNIKSHPPGVPPAPPAAPLPPMPSPPVLDGSPSAIAGALHRPLAVAGAVSAMMPTMHAMQAQGSMMMPYSAIASAHAQHVAGWHSMLNTNGIGSSLPSNTIHGTQSSWHTTCNLPRDGSIPHDSKTVGRVRFQEHYGGSNSSQRSDAVQRQPVKARADAILDAKHARERKQGKKKRKVACVEELHLPYHTLAELAEEVEDKIKNLFWFHHPHMLLWLVNIIFLITSLSMTTAVAFIIPYSKFQKLATLGQSFNVWMPVMVIDILMAVYLSYCVLPLYALITTAGTSFPVRVIEEVRAAKTLSHEDHHGISGMLLSTLNHLFVGVEHDHERNGTIDLATYFVASLADHAGIVLSPHLRSMASKGAATIMGHPHVRGVLREFAQYWHDLAWYGPPGNSYYLTSDLTFLKAAFGRLDEDGSGALSFGELAQMVRSLGALATAGDIETMLWEVDLDGSRSVGFDEFLKFLVYAFFDEDANGYIGLDEIEDSLKKLGFTKAGSEACYALMAAADHNEDGRLGMREFFMLFEKLEIEDDDDDQSSHAS